MSFHKTNFGAFGHNLPCDRAGYVPTAETGPWDLDFDFTAPTHDENDELTEYGEWWEDDGFPALQDEAIRATKIAVGELALYRHETMDGLMRLTTRDLADARACLDEDGGFLYDLGDGLFQVGDLHPAAMRSFDSHYECLDYAFRLAEAEYDETRMEW